MRPRPELIRDLMADLEIGHQRAREQSASGWVYVTVDQDSGTHVHVVGPFPTPEAALIAAQEQALEDAHFNPDEPLWDHHVLPLFSP